MKKVMAFGVVSLALSASVFAEEAPTNLLTMDGDDDIIFISDSQARSGASMPRRTSFFTGVEYSENVFDNAPKNETTRYIIADGSTRIHPNMRMRFVLSEGHTKEGNPQIERGSQLNYTLAPRYEKWVNPSFSYFAEPVLLRKVQADGSENREIKLKPGAQFTSGQHFLNSSAEYKMIQRERYATNDQGYNKKRIERVDFDAASLTVNYTYRYSKSFNYGANLSLNGTIDQSDYSTRSKSYGVKTFIRASHLYGITTEFNVRYNQNQSGEFWAGSDTYGASFNNNIRINQHLRLVANLGYSEASAHTVSPKNKNPAGDKTGMSVRVGANISF